MQPDSDVALEEIRHRRRGNAQEFLRHRLDQLVGGSNRRIVLAQEHRAVGREVIIVYTVARVEIHRPDVVVELTVGDDGLLVPQHRVTIVAALDVDVRRHVGEVAHIGADLAQPIAGDQRRFGMRRHFHQMDVQMQQAGVAHRARQRTERALQHLARFSRSGVGRGVAGALIPHAPRRSVHDRLDEDVAHVEVVWMCLMNQAHRRPATHCSRDADRRSGRAADSERGVPG